MSNNPDYWTRLPASAQDALAHIAARFGERMTGRIVLDVKEGHAVQVQDTRTVRFRTEERP